jgi:hypothetical protein
MSRAKTIEAIAEHFTGPQVAHNSVFLNMSTGGVAKMAQMFFDTRKQLGIRGYETKEEAVKILESLLDSDET